MGRVAAAVRAAAVAVATWPALLVLLVLLVPLLPGPRPHGTLWSTVLTLWLLALSLGPLIACVALRRWIAGKRAGSPGDPLPPGPYTRAQQEMPPSGGQAWRADASPPPPDEETRSQAPPAAEHPDSEAQRRARAQAQRNHAVAEQARAQAERARREEARRRAARNRRIRARGRRY